MTGIEGDERVTGAHASLPAESMAGRIEPAGLSSQPLVSVVINNYNYERYLPAAIESALGQTYDQVETVVVDDGSTDAFRSVLARYANDVVAVLKSNGGQGSAFNAGFEKSHGSIVMFLDSDDYLYPNAVQEVVGAFASGVAKVHFRLCVVDHAGVAVGEYPPPDAPLHSGDVVPLLLGRGHYSTAVSSGNAYSRCALAAVLPVPEEEFAYGADGYVNAVVPFHGEVRALEKVLGAYRAHMDNFSDMGGELDVSRFHYFISHQLAAERAVHREAARHGIHPTTSALLRYPSHVEARLASLRLDDAAHPVSVDRRVRLVLRGAEAAWRYTDVSITRRLFDTGWFLVVGLAPSAIARRAISWKYVRTSRPRVVRFLVRQVRRIIG